MPQPERREALPDHPVPAGLAAPEAWRLRVDGLGAQPLALSISEVDALGAQTHTADGVCKDGWMVPDPQWEGVAVAALLGYAGVQPSARFLKVYAGDLTVLVPVEEALPSGACLAHRLNGTPLTLDHGAPLRLVAPVRACFSRVTWVDRLEMVAEETPTTGESLARTRVPRGAGRTLPALTMSSRGVWGHEQGAPALRPSSRRTLVDRDTRLAMVAQQGKERR
jgi:DMSO/TMAO reductase YedYZ molybdopterin-dependent catalytic subunit